MVIILLLVHLLDFSPTFSQQKQQKLGESFYKTSVQMRMEDLQKGRNENMQEDYPITKQWVTSATYVADSGYSLVVFLITIVQ